MKPLYPEIEPFNSFFLKTETLHSIYVEQCGNPDGLPVLFLHGGPCSGCKPDHRRFFDPARYHIILFDQRGCGRSLPYGELERNSTQDLLADMEAIRECLQIRKWLLFGGSWGGTLALLYAQKYTQRVIAMVLRGVFLARQKDLDWFIREGAGRVFPEQWHQLMACIPKSKRNDPVPAIWEILNSQDELARLRTAREWTLWGAQVSVGADYSAENDELHVNKKLMQHVMMEMHYAVNGYFLEEGRLLSNCGKLEKLPITLIHGRNDMVCPMESAFSLYQVIPHAQYVVLTKGGHIAQGEDMIDALVSASDQYAERFHAG